MSEEMKTKISATREEIKKWRAGIHTKKLDEWTKEDWNFWTWESNQAMSDCGAFLKAKGHATPKSINSLVDSLNQYSSKEVTDWIKNNL